METLDFILLVIGLAIFYFLGSFVKQFLKKRNLFKKESLGMVEGSVLALFAFFLGFTFSISASKLETIRQSSTEEANNIGTALMRTELYPDSIQMQYKKLFTTYVKSRVDYFAPDKDKKDYESLYNASLEKGNDIWAYTVKHSKTKQFTEESRLMIPAVNSMLDIITTRNSDINSYLPNTIIYTLLALSFCSCFIVGFSGKDNNISHVIGFIYILVIALTVNLILDASDPRSGYINTDKANGNIIAIYEDLQK